MSVSVRRIARTSVTVGTEEKKMLYDHADALFSTLPVQQRTVQFVPKAHLWVYRWQSSRGAGPGVWAFDPASSYPACGTCDRSWAWPCCGSRCGSTLPVTSGASRIRWPSGPRLLSPLESEPELWIGLHAPAFPLRDEEGKYAKIEIEIFVLLL